MQTILDPATERRIHQLAAARRRTPDDILREAVEQYAAREEKREQFRQDAHAAWDDFQATGLHATAEEADAWLASLETGEETPPPTCHV